MLAKTCTKCHKEMTLDNFHKASRGKNGLSAICKTCTSDAGKINRANLITITVENKKCSKCDEIKFRCEQEGREYIDKNLIKEGFKICSTCKIEKEKSNFTKECARCKDCVRKEEKIIVTEKYCSKCKETKKSHYFNKSYQTKDGLANTCKPCKKILFK